VLFLVGRALQPANASGLGTFASHRFLDTGCNIRTGVLDSPAEGSAFTSARYRLAIESAAEKHADFDTVARAVESGEGNQSRNGSYKESHDDSDFQIKPL